MKKKSTESKRKARCNFRASTITTDFVGSKFKVHNGLKHKIIMVTKDMLGRKLGEFFDTKKICVYRRKKKKRGIKGRTKGKKKAKAKSKSKKKKRSK